MTTRDMVTTEQFEEYVSRPEHSEQRFELINGEIVEKAMPTRLHGRIGGLFAFWFNNFFIAHPEIAGDVAVEARHRPTGDRYNDRIPDVSVVLEPKPILDRGVEDYIPDICIEIQSPDDSLKTMREKAQFYLANGAKYVLIVRTNRRIVEVYPLDGDFDVLTIADTLTFGDLLPGFSVPVAKLFPS